MYSAASPSRWPRSSKQSRESTSMPDNVQVVERTIEAYKSDEKPTWCPGCGDFGVLNALYNAVRAKGWDPKDIVLVSGIGFSSRPKELADIVVKGIDHNGFAVVDVYSPCPTFNKVNTFKAYREETADLPADYDPSDKLKAFEYAASESPLWLGVLYEKQGDSFEDHI